MFFPRRSRVQSRATLPARAMSRPVRVALVLARAVGTVLAGVVLSLLLTVGLELAQGWRKPWPAPWERLVELETGVLAIGVVLVWAVLALLHALTGRWWLAALGTTTLVALIAVANHTKLELRGEPLFVSDAIYLTRPGFLIENAGVGPVLVLVVPLAVVAAGAWLLARSRTGRLSHDAGSAAPARAARWPRAVTRVVAGTAAAAVIAAAAAFNAPGNAVRELYESAGATWRPWNQAQNYGDNGVIAGLLYNLPAAPMIRPEGYSAATMADLAQRYGAVATGLNSTRQASALDDTNIVLVLSESLSDPMRMPGISAEEDPLPFLRDLMATNTSGTLLSGGFGGGTSSVEFEVLTGMAVANLQPQVDSPFPGLVAQTTEFPSHLRTLAGPERDSRAVHPYHGEFYRRTAVYPALGIDRMDFQDSLRDLARLPGDKYTSDAALFDKVVDSLAESETPMLVNVVTMQNHGPQEGLADPMSVEGPLTAQESEVAGQYLRGLKHSDDALRDFAEDLSGMEERTIVLLYGDHLPSVWPQAVLDASGPTGRFETPWVVFANFPTQMHHPGTVGANQLVNQVLDAAGAPHTPWTALLHELRAELPALERTGWLGPDGQLLSEDDLSARGRQLLHDYRLAQYDMAAGQGWATDTLLTVPGS